MTNDEENHKCTVKWGEVWYHLLPGWVVKCTNSTCEVELVYTRRYWKAAVTAGIRHWKYSA